MLLYIASTIACTQTVLYNFQCDFNYCGWIDSCLFGSCCFWCCVSRSVTASRIHAQRKMVSMMIEPHIDIRMTPSMSLSLPPSRRKALVVTHYVSQYLISLPFLTFNCLLSKRRKHQLCRKNKKKSQAAL